MSVQTIFGSTTVLATANRSFLNGVFTGTSQHNSEPIVAGGALSNWYLELTVAPGAGTSRTFTIHKNDVATAMTITISGTATTGSYISTPVSWATDDTIRLVSASSGSPADGILRSAIDWTPDVANQSIFGWSGPNTSQVENGLNVAICGGSANPFSSTSAFENTGVLACPGTITAHRCKLRTAPGSGKSRTWTLVLNGVVQDGSGATVNTVVTISDANTAATTSFSLPVAAGDTLAVRLNGINSPGPSTWSSGTIAFSPTTGSQSMTSLTAIDVENNGASEYAYPCSYKNATGTTEEQLIGGTAIDIGAIYVGIAVAAGAGNSWTWTLRKNGADTALAVTISGASAVTGFATVTPPIAITSADRWSLQVANSSIPAAATQRVSLLIGEAGAFGVQATAVLATFVPGDASIGGSISIPATAALATFTPGTAEAWSNVPAGPAVVTFIPVVPVIIFDQTIIATSALLTFTAISPEVFVFLPPNPADGGLVGLGINPAVGTGLCGAQIPLAFVDWRERVFSSTQINDPATYYKGPKSPLVMSFGSAERAMSGWDGQFETSSASVTFSDDARGIRESLGANYGARNSLIDFYMYSDVGRRALVTARRLYQGVVKTGTADSPLTANLAIEDWFGSQFSSFDINKPIPIDLILPSYFPNAPIDILGTPEPCGAYGLLSDEVPAASATGAPVVTGVTFRGYFVDGGVKNSGFGENDDLARFPFVETSPGSGIANIGLAVSAGGTLAAGEWGIMLTSVDVNGRESDPYPFYSDAPGAGFPGHVPKITVSGTQKITVTFAHDPLIDPTGVYVRVYLGRYSFGARWTQYIQVPVATTSVIFTASALNEATTSLANVTPGAVPTPYSAFAWYYITAVMADGETVASARTFHIQRGYRRFNWIEWLPVVGALKYRIYKAATQVSDAYARWEVPATQTVLQDDMLGTGSAPWRVHVPEGTVQSQYVGQFDLGDGLVGGWGGHLICRGACAGIISWFASDLDTPTPARIKMPEGTEGTDFKIPGRASWFATFGAKNYIDINDRRYFMAFARGPRNDAAADGTIPLTFNFWGYESVGDGTGAYIDNLALQYLHFLTNLSGIQPIGKLWQTIPLNKYGYSIINGASFDDVKTYYDTIIPGGLRGAWILGAKGEEVQLGANVARLNQNLDVESFINANGQYHIRLIDVTELPVDDVNYVRDVQIDTLKIYEDQDEFFDEIQYYYGKTYIDQVTKETPPEDELLPRELSDTSEWQSGVVGVYDPVAIATFGEVRTMTLELFMIRDQSSADLIARRKIVKYSYPPLKVSFDMNLCATDYELGDFLSLTHFAGLSLTGWTDIIARLERVRVDIDNLKVSLECRLINFVFDAGAEVPPYEPPEEIPSNCASGTTIYTQNWSGGNGPQSMAAALEPDGYYERTPYGVDTQDTVYSELISSEAVQVLAGGGPAGENVLDFYEPIGNPGDDYQTAGVALGEFGPLSGGYWHAQSGCVQVSYKPSATSIAENAYAPLVEILQSPYGNNVCLMLALDNGNYGVGNLGLELFWHSWTLFGEYEEAHIFTIASVQDTWVTFRMEWDCGTPTLDGSGAISSVAMDGSVRVYMNDILVYTLSNVNLHFSPDTGRVNCANGVWLGYFGLWGKCTNLVVKGDA